MYKMDEEIVIRDLQNDFPKTKREFVKAADIGTNYVSGSEGQTKVENYYDTEDVLRATVTYKYEDTDYPDQWTEVITDVKAI